MMMKGKEMTNRFNDAFDFIVGAASNEELENLVSAIKERRAILARRAKCSIRVGSAVKFSHRGVIYLGKVTAIRTKKAAVACTSPVAITYNVPMNMLEAA
jgi:hypothetical protein